MTLQKILAFGLGPIGASILGIAAVPMVAWYFTPEDIGRITMLQVAISFCLLLLSLGLDQAYVREYYKEKNKPELLFNTLMPGLLAMLIFLTPFLFGPSALSLMLFDIDSDLVGVSIFFMLLGSFLSRFLSLVLRLEERGIAFSLSQILPKLVFLIVVGSYALLSLKADFLKLVGAHFVSINLILIILLINTRKEWISSLRQKFKSNKLKNMLVFSVPLLLSGIAYWGLTSVDKIFIRKLSTFNELGIYAIAVNFAAVATIFQGIFGLLWSPWIYKIEAEGKLTHNLISQAQRKTTLIAVLIFCFVGLFSWSIDWLLPPTYNEAKYILVACIGLPIFYTLSEVTGIGVGVTKKTIIFMWATFGTLFICLALNYLMVQIYGASGAAVSTCISLWLFFVLKTELSSYLWISFSRFYIYLLPTICLLSAVLMALKLIEYKYSILLWALILIASLLIYKKDFFDILHYLRSILKIRINKISE